MSNKLLEVTHLTKFFNSGGLFGRTRLAAVDDVSLSLDGDRPSILSVVGELGSGKTTLARILLKLIEPSSGQILLNGRDLFHGNKRWQSREFRMALQPIFQNPFEAFSSHRTVDSYLFETALNLHVAETNREAEIIISDMIASIGLDFKAIRGKYPNQLSGGELQRVSVARAMLPHPKLVIADEPVSMVDASLRMNLVNLFLDLKSRYDVSFVYITHDLSTAYYISDMIAIMFRGNIVEYGPSNVVLTNPVHPYTELLMASIPEVGKKWAEITDVPDLENLQVSSTGCKFASRCAYARDICRSQRPPMVDVGNGQQAMCFKPVNYEPAVTRVEPVLEHQA